MKVILKMFGLPRTGTNLLHLLLNLNFKNYVCGKAEHNQDHFGWKHAVPRDIEHYLELEGITGETIRFLFTSRGFESWQNSYLNFSEIHQWESPKQFRGGDKFVFCTPVGMEIYRDLRDLYDTKTDIYRSFCQLNPDRAMIVPFELMTRDQEGTVRFIQDKFGLERAQKHIVTIPKHINSEGVLVDMQQIINH